MKALLKKAKGAITEERVVIAIIVIIFVVTLLVAIKSVLNQ